MNKLDPTFLKVSYAGLVVLAVGIFTSVSFSALSHILLFPTGLYFLARSLKSKSFNPPAHWWALLVMALICILSVIFNWEIIDRPFKNILKTKYFIVALLSYFSFDALKKDFLSDKRVSLILKLFIVATSVATVSGLIGLWHGFNPLKFKAACHPARACGLYGMYMTYGYGMSLYMVLMTGFLVYRRRISTYLSLNWILVGWIVGMLGLIFSFARGGWLGFLAAIPFLFFKDHKKKFFTVVLAALVVLGGAFGLSSKVRDVFTNRSESNSQRLDFFKAAIYAFKEKPLLGYGYKNFEPNSKEIKKRYNIGSQHFMGHAHNNALEHLASTGLLGLIAFLSFFFLWLRHAYREPILFAFIISFGVSGLFQYTFGDGENLFLILGIFSLF